MGTSIFETKLKPSQLAQLCELATAFLWHYEKQDSCPADDAVLERIKAQKCLLDIRAFLNRFGILPSMHQDRLRQILIEWFQARHTRDQILELFENLEAHQARTEDTILVPWSGKPPVIPWHETAKGYDFEMAIAPRTK